MKLPKKNKLLFTLILVNIFVFFGLMIGFVVNACTIQNVPLAWVLFGFIIFNVVSFITLVVLLFVFNKERIKNYLKEIR